MIKVRLILAIHSPSTEFTAERELEMPALPRIGDEVIGFGIGDSPVQIAEVSGVTFDLDRNVVLVFMAAEDPAQLSDDEANESRGVLHGDGWRIHEMEWTDS